MERAREYRWFAARCLEIARTTTDGQTKAAMLQMAQVWSRLAEHNTPSLPDIGDNVSPLGIDSGPRRS
jgi:hypothetical protein